MTRLAQWTLDVHDLDTMATFWSQVLGYRSSSATRATLIYGRPKVRRHSP